MKEIQGKSSLLAKIIFLSPCETSASREGEMSNRFWFELSEVDCTWYFVLGQF